MVAEIVGRSLAAILLSENTVLSQLKEPCRMNVRRLTLHALPLALFKPGVVSTREGSLQQSLQR